MTGTRVHTGLYVRLENTQVGSDKFYDLYLVGNVVMFTYGKRGSAGTANLHLLSSDSVADKEWTDKLNQKCSKGYKEVDRLSFTLRDEEMARLVGATRPYGMGVAAARKTILQPAVESAQGRRSAAFGQNAPLPTPEADPFSGAELFDSYSVVIGTTNKILAEAKAGAGLDDLLELWGEVGERWDRLNERHQEAVTRHSKAEVLMAEARKVVTAKLMGG